MLETYNLDKRLLTATKFVRQNCVFADIGTDHGHLPIYLIENEIAKSGFACDINKLPLDKAKEIIKSYNLEDKISTYLCDGLELLKDKHIDDIIIAGMGGEMIIHILNNAKWIQNKNTHLILQPMTKTKELRKYLCENGFTIEQEQGVKSGRFVYTVLSVYYNGKKATPSDVFTCIGMLGDKKDEDSVAYINYTLKKLREKADGLSKSDKLTKERDDVLSLINRIEKELEKRGGIK